MDELGNCSIAEKNSDFRAMIGHLQRSNADTDSYALILNFSAFKGFVRFKISVPWTGGVLENNTSLQT